MRVVGSIIFTKEDAKDLALRVTVTVPRLAWMTYARRKVCTGDLFWVREPFVEYRDKKCPWQNDIGYGDPITAKKPDWFKAHAPHRIIFWAAEKMTRVQSRYTLEVIAIKEDRSLHCWVYPEQMNRHLKKGAVA